MLTFESFTGINNVAPEHRLGSADMLVAQDVDIGLTGEVSRRSGWSEVSDQCHKNVHQAQGFMLATCGAELVAIHPGGARHIIHPALGHERVWYCDLPDGRTAFSNGLIHGVTDGAVGLDRCVPEPAGLGSVDAIFGDLFAGQYRYHLTHVRLADRLEGPAISSAPITVTDQGGLRLDGLPARDGYAINVYLSGKDGEGAYLAGVTTGRSFEYTGGNAHLVLPCRTLGAEAFPLGTITAFWRGRLLVASGDVLWAGRPSTVHLSDWRDFKSLAAQITAIIPVDDGIFVGTTQDLIFLSGNNWDSLVHVPTRCGPVVLGSGLCVPGRWLKLGDGTGGGQAGLCIAGGEVVAGFSGGQTSSLTANRYRTDVREVCATFRVTGGVPQYMVAPQ